MEYLHAEGQEVSSDIRFGLFAGCEGKGSYEGKPVHTPKGRRFQENINSECSQEAEATRKSQSSMFTRRRAGGFRRTPL